MKFNHTLDVNDYNLYNVLFWGNFLGHSSKTLHGTLGTRLVHLAIAAIELLPIISQIASLAEID